MTVLLREVETLLKEIPCERKMGRELRKGARAVAGLQV